MAEGAMISLSARSSWTKSSRPLPAALTVLERMLLAGLCSSSFPLGSKLVEAGFHSSSPAAPTHISFALLLPPSRPMELYIY